MADAGFLGITMPVELGGSGLGVTEAAVMMHTVTQHGGGMAAASSIHINLFGPHPIVVHGTEEQKQRWLPPLIAGENKVAFGVTEPDAGLDTTSIKTFAHAHERGLRDSRPQDVDDDGAGRGQDTLVDAHHAERGLQASLRRDDLVLYRSRPLQDRSPSHPEDGPCGRGFNAVFIDDLAVPETDRVGEEGKGFRYLFDSLNPERILFGVEAVGLGRDALRRAAAYAKERVVFGRPIGQNQGIQHPLAENWAYLESAFWMCMRAASLYDSKQPCGAEANAAKFLGARAAFNAATQAVMTHGGMGYAKEYQVERLMRESVLTRIVPVTEQLILSFIGENVLDLPKSY